MPGIFDEPDEPITEQKSEHLPLIRPFHEPESTAETSRRSGLAYSAGIVFFGSVAFMLLLGWGADLIIGSSPWGIVGGIVLGSIIGFVQFFRLTSRIFGEKSDTPSTHPLTPDDEDQNGPAF
jgi:F0F1-type ATP synthase assembly protein I